MKVCKTCRKPNSTLVCELCDEGLCKSCAQFLPEGSFTYLKKIPKELGHSIYCSNCYDDQVAAPLADYEDKLERARNVIIYSKAQTQLTRLVNRKAEPVSAENCEDEQEALLRMSFSAVEGNYNALIYVEIKSKKIIVGSHKKTIFSATSIPANIDITKLRGHKDDY